MGSSGKATMLKEFIHDHKLQLIRVDREADIRICEACTQPIIDNWCYNCPIIECNYFMHKFCGDLPELIKHGFHPGHTLTLIRYNKNNKCHACWESNEGYHYTCNECSNFVIDLICATSANRQLEHHGHPHPLILQRREILTRCNCCGKDQTGRFYQCQKCLIFWIHEECASFGPEVNSPRHPHPLSFVYSDHPHYEVKHCDICYGYVDDGRSWYLRCVPCNFFSHVYCAMFEKNNEEVTEIDSEIPHLPWEDGEGEFGIVGLLNRKIATNDEDVKKQQMKIIHFSHPEHELILQDELPKAEDTYTGHQIPLTTKCNGCTRKISSPFYRCLDCDDFFLHKCCALIPNSIPQHRFHPKHDSNLVQSCKPWRVDEVFFCDCCRQLCNGFYFQCEEVSCQYKLDLECAFLPPVIVHKSHPSHPLTLDISNKFVREASCCKQYNSLVGKSYGCVECKFNIHINCAMYPTEVSHRYDHEKPFKLWYDRGPVEANYFYCESCEKFMDPKAWYYHSKSSIGDQLMHPNCILQRDHPGFPKFKSTKQFLQVDIHPHRLHLSTSRTSFSFFKTCGHCGQFFQHIQNRKDQEVEDLILSYNCWEIDCGFRLHHSCAVMLRGRDSTYAQEYPHE